MPKNREAATVHLDTDVLPQGSIAPSTVTQNKVTEALVFIEATQEYLLIAPNLIHKLNARKIHAAIHPAQTTPDTPES